MYRRILVPLDGSPLAEAALPHAIELAKCTGAGITLFQVSSVMPVATTLGPLTVSGADAAIAMEAMEADEKAAAEYLAEVARRKELAGIPVQTEVVRGAAAVEIVERARAGDVDLIAMSTHGRSGLGRLVFGSVADQVLREARMPILLIRPREE
jgi:nucleotide-binding universal stress UspA family protein